MIFLKKTFLLIIGIVFIYTFLGNIITSKKLIPDDAIRIRVIPNSNSTYDQEMKKLVKEELQTDMYNLLKDVKGSSDARRVINDNLENVNSKINTIFVDNNYDMKYTVNFGLNYFPEKEYKGLKYDEGYYEFKPTEKEKTTIITKFVQAIDVIAQIRNENEYE